MSKEIIPSKSSVLLSDEIKNFPSFGNSTFIENFKKVEKALQTVEKEQKKFNHSHSQFAWKHFVIGGQHSESRSIRQIASEMQNKKMALVENFWKIHENSKQIEILVDRAKKEKVALEKEAIEIQIYKIKSQVETTIMYYEGAMKDVLTLHAIYKDLTNGFTSEEDFEKAEADYMLRRQINQAIWDCREFGQIRIGDQEALEQIGINPTRLHQDIAKFVEAERKGNDVDTKLLHKFLDEMSEKYKQCPDKALKLMGISTEIVKESLFYDNQGGEDNGKDD